MGPRRRGSPFAVERCSYSEIMSGLHLLHLQTSSFFGCWCRPLTVVQRIAYFPPPLPRVIVRQIGRDDKRCNELIGDFNDYYQRVSMYIARIYWARKIFRVDNNYICLRYLIILF